MNLSQHIIIHLENPRKDWHLGLPAAHLTQLLPCRLQSRGMTTLEGHQGSDLLHASKALARPCPCRHPSRAWPGEPEPKPGRTARETEGQPPGPPNPCHPHLTIHCLALPDTVRQKYLLTPIIHKEDYLFPLPMVLQSISWPGV